MSAQRELILDFFTRISSNGTQAVGDVFSDDGRYEGVYAGTPETSPEQNALVGPAAITKFFRDAFTKVVNPFEQWVDTVYIVDDSTALAEGRSRGAVRHDGSTYQNRYSWVFHFKGDRISLVREYFNPEWYHRALGPEFPEILAQVFTGDEYPAAE